MPLLKPCALKISLFCSPINFLLSPFLLLFINYSSLLFFKIYLFYLRVSYREGRRRERIFHLLVHCWLIWNLELLLGISHGYSQLPSQVISRELGSEVEQSGLKLVPVGNAAAQSGRLACHATGLAPIFRLIATPSMCSAV